MLSLVEQIYDAQIPRFGLSLAPTGVFIGRGHLLLYVRMDS
jgi:hypothetical protein